jgi:GTP diphosphokinase / guanosine-3',5'-bis(diphosphate) 3'-diphosphatase
MSINEILDIVRGYSPDADTNVIVRAYLFSAQAHRGQTRKSGEDYLIHPIAVARLLADLRMDIDTIATGLLHDTMEDCLTTHEAVTEEFGLDVADMVDGVTKIGKLQFRTQQEAQAENFRKLILSMSKDVRVVLVKLADRLHNMLTMEHMPPNKQQRISQETLDIYAPIANRLGLAKLKSQLEDLCFRYLHPELYAGLTAALAERAPEHDQYLEQMQAELEDGFKRRGLDAKIYGRVKHLVSIHKKMMNNNLDFEEVHDLLAFRILVETEGDCYIALGLIHALFPHVPGRFKDYIAQSKSNGYQSLHTVVIGPAGQQFELQVRTQEMHRIAEVGIAAHWRYKEGHLALSKDDISQIARLRALFEAAREVTDPTEFLETVKIDLFANEIFVFTPRGDVKFFPSGATALDFAYSIHTEVGHRCTGAKAHGRMVPMRYALQNGDRMEIITATSQNPSRDWLEIAKTGRALSKIRRYIREEEREKGRALGRELLESELKKHDKSLNKLIRSGEMSKLARKFGHRKPEQLYLDIAQGNTVLKRVLAEIVPPEETPTEEVSSSNPITSFINRMRKRSVSPVLISGEEDVLTSYARCCNPLPGESVAGFITRGRGITVHKAACRELLSLEPERRVKVQWHSESKSRHSGELEVVCANKPGMLADLGAICKTLNINVTRMNASTMDDGKALLNLEVSVLNINELGSLMRNIKKLKGVIRVDRRTN